MINNNGTVEFCIILFVSTRQTSISVLDSFTFHDVAEVDFHRSFSFNNFGQFFYLRILLLLRISISKNQYFQSSRTNFITKEYSQFLILCFLELHFDQ